MSNRIGFVKFGVRYHSKRPIVVFMVWFFVFRLLLAINVSLVGVVSKLAVAIMFSVLAVTSFVVCVVNRLFRSVWLYMAMCVMELMLVYMGVQTIIEAVNGPKQIFSVLFIVMFALTQLSALVCVIIDLVLRIIRCCKVNKQPQHEPDEPKTGTKL